MPEATTGAAGAPAQQRHAGDRHVFVTGDRRRDRRTALTALALPPAAHPGSPVLDAHHRAHGPYSVAGALLRALVPAALERHPELVAAHEVEILIAAPELRDLVPATMETLTSLAAPEERTRFYARMRTLRIAHGLTEFLAALLTADGRGPRSLVVDDLDHADVTDREFLAVLLRRTDPAVLTVAVGGGAGLAETPAPDPRLELGTPVGEDLSAALRRFCRTVEAPALPEPPAPEDAVRAATVYVDGDCRDDDPAVRAAYAALPEAQRQALHDRRAAELAATGERGALVGPAPYHYERGSDPLGGGADAIIDALDTLVLAGFYDAAIDLCERGRALASWDEQPRLRWKFMSKMPTTLSALGRTREAEEVCDEARANMTDPRVHAQCAYATAMLYTRHREPGRRDHERAMAWINEAIAISTLLVDPKDRAFNTVFNNNGLALIEGHRGRPERALELVSAGVTMLDETLDLDEHGLHRSVLHHNRASVLSGLGRFEEALREYRSVIALDPYYPEYHLDMGILLQRMGHLEEAAAEYETARRLGPPIPELYYNRGDLRSGEGDIEGALADFGYVLELDPAFLDAYVNRAGLMLDLGEPDVALRDVEAGLELDPGNALLLAALGRVHAEHGDLKAAREAFDRALEADDSLVPALLGRAEAAFQDGDTEAALTDLGRAVELAPGDPVARYNRAFVLRETGRFDDAIADLEVAAELTPDDEDVLTALSECRSSVAAG